MSYKVGDKVVFVDAEKHRWNPEFYPKVGTVGIVKNVHEPNLTVQWPNGSTSLDDCWYCAMESVNLSKPREALHIYHQGNETHCIHFMDGKKYETTAKCSPNDTYDFLRGAMIALGRMLGR